MSKRSRSGLSKFHQHKDGTRGWDYYKNKEKIHVTTRHGKDSPRNRGIIEGFIDLIFGKDKNK